MATDDNCNDDNDGDDSSSEDLSAISWYSRFAPWATRRLAIFLPESFKVIMITRIVMMMMVMMVMIIVSIMMSPPLARVFYRQAAKGRICQRCRKTPSLLG